MLGTYQSAGQVTITGNALTCTGSTASAVILGSLANDPTWGYVKDSVLAGNTITMTGIGNVSQVIQCDGISSCLIANNTIIGTSTVWSGVAFLGADTNNRVIGNSFRGAVNGVLLQAGGAVNNTIAANTFDGQLVGVLLNSTATVPVGTEVRENRFLATVVTPVTDHGTGTIISNNGGLTTGSVMHLDGTETITGVKTFASLMTMGASCQVNRTGAGTGNNQYWYIGIQDAAASDGILFGWSSTTYTTGGSMGWLGNNTPFLYFPPGSTFQFGTGSASTGCVMELAGTGVTTTGTTNLAGGNFAVDPYGHALTAGTTPGIVFGTGAGSSHTGSITGNDMCGYITLNVGTSPAGTATVATITFANDYAAAPRAVFLTPLNANAIAAVTAQEIYASQTNISAGGWVLTNNSKTSLTAGYAYVWGYLVMG